MGWEIIAKHVHSSMPLVKTESALNLPNSVKKLQILISSNVFYYVTSRDEHKIYFATAILKLR